ncbi:hypothetical protein HYC85_028124 [Camellia sinensis]|uniref:ABC transmembrane type-1 domain-containing protein n=1 Tax=Camellia sinensis TaxID=4442 RepID=A0A7J7FU80_CAMSI|nr:hypothetical protein HYC85_028124 [Camellia sinensis]
MKGTPFETLVSTHRNVITILDLKINENYSESQKGDTDHLEETKGPYLSKGNKERNVYVEGLPEVQLTEEEEKENGNVGWKPFFDYILVSKGSLFLCLTFPIQIPNISNVILIRVYTIISTMSALFVYLWSLFAALLGLKASKVFFSGFINSVFDASMLFFDSTPIGWILTRASSNLSVLDFNIPSCLAFVYVAVIELLTIIGIMASVTCVRPSGFKICSRYYQASARELTRINGTTKAPIMNYATEKSLGVNLTLFTAVFLLILLPIGYVALGLVGLFSNALALTVTQVFMTRWYSSFCNYIISVERIKQFMRIPPEPPAIVEDKRPPSSWPSKWKIELHDLKWLACNFTDDRYRSNARLVLNGITCIFTEGTKVGIVGRTGNGKTMLVSALFRLVQPDSGKILIDGLDICSIGLKDLRMKLSIIP